MTGHRLGLPFQLHRADTLQFVVSSSNAGLFIPHFAGVGSSWRIAMKRGSVKGPQRRYAAASPFGGGILATPPHCHSILFERTSSAAPS